MDEVKMDTKQLYQGIYDDESWYGNAEINRCPGFRYIPLYLNHINGRVIDMGCGRGHSTLELRKRGVDCDGIDQIKLDNDMLVGSILDDLNLYEYTTSLCIDVIEHIPIDDITNKLFNNFKKCERQIFSIHNDSSILNGVELHITRKSFDEWDKIISEHFTIIEKIQLDPNRVLYVTENNN